MAGRCHASRVVATQPSPDTDLGWMAAAIAGPLRPPDGPDSPVRAVVTVPCPLPLRPARSTADKRRHVWRDPDRHRCVAGVARGVRSARPDDPPRVLVLVENEEHAESLQKELPWDAVASKDGDVSPIGPRKEVIATQTAVEKRGWAGDVIVRATAGRDRIQLGRCQPGMIIVDILEDTADGRTRVADYTGRGWTLRTTGGSDYETVLGKVL
jgi:hypothetical protein